MSTSQQGYNWMQSFVFLETRNGEKDWARSFSIRPQLVTPLWEWFWTKAILDWSETHWCLEPYLQSVCRCIHRVAIWVHKFINKLLKADLKLGKVRLSKGNPNPESRTNPRSWLYPRFAFTFAKRLPWHLNESQAAGSSSQATDFHQRPYKAKSVFWICLWGLDSLAK